MFNLQSSSFLSYLKPQIILAHFIQLVRYQPLSLSRVPFLKALLLSFGLLSFAFYVQAKPSPNKEESKSSQAKTLNYNIEDLKVGKKTLSFSFQNETKNLGFHGKGRRTKTIAFMSFKVYDVSLFTPQELIKESNAFKILEAQNLAIVLEPLRNFPGKKMKASVLDSYKLNSVDAKSKPQKTFLKLISQNKIKKGEDIVLIGHKGKDKDYIYIHKNGQTQKIEGHSGFANEIFAIWLGKIEDKQLQEVKDALL